MTNEKFKHAIFEALTAEYENSVPVIDEHIFSPQFERKMAKLIKRREKSYYKMINTLSKRIACFVLGVIIAASAVIISVDALRNAVVDFFINVFDKFSVVRAYEKNISADTIEDFYEITYNLSGYSYEVWFSDEYSRMAEYTNGEIYINFNQSSQSVYDTLLNTENAAIEYVTINGKEAICFCDNQSYNHLIWNNDGCVISLSSNIDKNTLIDIACSVQKAEK